MMTPIFFFLDGEENKYKVAKVPISRKEEYLKKLVKFFENDFTHVRVSNGRIRYRGNFSYLAFAVSVLALLGLTFIQVLPVVFCPLIAVCIGGLIGWFPKKIDKILLLEGKKFLYLQFNVTHGSAYMWAILDDTDLVLAKEEKL